MLNTNAIKRCLVKSFLIAFRKIYYKLSINHFKKWNNRKATLQFMITIEPRILSHCG